MYITDEEFKTMDLATVNKVLERLHNKTIEDTLKLLPDVIIGLVIKSKGVHQAFEKFKEDHPEFKGKEKELAEIVQDIELSNGALTIDEILKKVPETYQKTKLAVSQEQPKTAEELERTCNGFL